MTHSDPSNTIEAEFDAALSEREMRIEWVLERLDELKGWLADIEEGLNPPHLPPLGIDWPVGGESALEAIGHAIFAAERRWAR